MDLTDLEIKEELLLGNFKADGIDPQYDYATYTTETVSVWLDIDSGIGALIHLTVKWEDIDFWEVVGIEGINNMCFEEIEATKQELNIIYNHINL